MLLSAENLTKVYGGLVAVNHLSFHVEEGEILSVIGPNGAGKTTCFKLISAFESPTQGRVIFKNQIISGMRPDQVGKLGMSRTFQITEPFPNMTALENVMVGAFIRYPSTRAATRKAKEVLEQMGMSPKAHIAAKNLTLADHKLLEIAKGLATEPSLMLLDEVMAGLTPTEVEELIALIKQLRDSGITFLMIEHVMQAVMALADRVVVLHNGEKIAEGSPSEVTSNKEVIKAYLGEEGAIIA